jgi:hypothetical protein
MAVSMTIEERQARITEIRARQEELHTEFAGQTFPDDTRSEFESLAAERVDHETACEELEQRSKYLADEAKKTENRESGLGGFQTRRPDAVTGDDIYDLTTVRSNFTNPHAMRTKAHAFVPFSHEAGEDWGALESEMGRLFQDAKDDEEATAFVTGAGTTVNPQGFVTGATSNNVAAASGLTVTAANLYALEAALPPRFRPNLTFVANRGIYNVIRGIDTAGGAALWLYVSQGLDTQTPAPGNTGAVLVGKPAYEATAMQATVVNATKIMVAVTSTTSWCLTASG